MTAPVNNASFYADFGSLSALKRDARANEPAALRAAAQQFESLFTNMMLKSMRAASFGDALTGSSDVEFYQGMFDQQLAVQLSKGRGMGLADMLVHQLTRSGLVAGSADAQAATGVPQSAAAITEVTQQSAATDDSRRQALLNVMRAVLDEQGRGADYSGPGSPGSMAALVSSYMPSDPELAVDSGSAVSDARTWPPGSPAEFVSRMLPQAQAAADQLGVDARTLVAHAALETGWGKHVPCNADGSSSFNLFGIKADSQWQGRKLDAATLEFEQGGMVRKVERFKAYDSPADCFADYARLLGGARRYSAARNAGSDSLQFAQGLQRGGYATDPDYASKLHAVANAVLSLKTSAAQVPAPHADI